MRRALPLLSDRQEQLPCRFRLREWLRCDIFISCLRLLMRVVATVRRARLRLRRARFGPHLFQSVRTSKPMPEESSNALVAMWNCLLLIR